MRTKDQVLSRARKLLEAAINSTENREAGYRLEEIALHREGYGEPGYSDPDSGVVATGNWNRISKYDESTREFQTLDDTLPRLSKAFENIGIEIEWSDEWDYCIGCAKLVRTQADSYGWKRSFWLSTDGCVCHECVKGQPEDYLEELEGNDSSCLTIDLDLSQHGYRQVDQEFENGFFEGQNADPKVIGESLRDRGITKYIYVLDQVQQFDMKFTVWIHESQFKQLGGSLSRKETDGPNIKANLEKALSGCSIGSGGNGIQVTKIDVGNGTSRTKLVSPQEFVDGKALDD